MNDVISCGIMRVVSVSSVTLITWKDLKKFPKHRNLVLLEPFFSWAMRQVRHENEVIFDHRKIE